MRRMWRWLLCSLGAFCALATGSTSFAAEDFLPPEDAFRFSARALDDGQLEIRFDVADGYYLYREQFKFAAEGASLGVAAVPAGKVKYDETFQKDVETHRGRVNIRLPVTAAPAAFTLEVTSQGCADLGLCYPPMKSAARVQLKAFGGDGSVRVIAAPGVTTAAPSKLANASPMASPMASPAALPSTAGPATAGNVASSADDAALTEEGRLDAALRGGRPVAVIAVFFVAGLLLSFTPCVLPMLPILSSIIVGQHGAGGRPSRRRGLALATAYSLGMALVYTALGIAAGLAGEGLAGALQTPWVLGSFAALLALLSLSMFGVYDLQLPASWTERVAGSSGRMRGGRVAGVFAMGGLSALIVSPCVAAPLAGALLYISQTRDVVLGAGALFSLAAGMSVPLMLLGASAGSLLPRAGAWMEEVKQGFGVLLLAVAWWIVAPVLPAVVVVLGWGLLLLFAASLLHAFDRLPDTAAVGARLRKAGGLALGVVGAMQLAGAGAGATDPLRPLAPFVPAYSSASAGAVATAPVVGARAPGSGDPALRTDGESTNVVHRVAGLEFRRVATLAELDAVVAGAGRPVLLDFYADWCVSCKEMERFTFSDSQVQQKLAGSLLLQVDVTRNTDDDRALLKRFKLFGPPGIVFFDAAGFEVESVRVIGFQNAERFLTSLKAAGL